MRAQILAAILALSAGAATAQPIYDDPGRALATQQLFDMAQRDNLYRQQDFQAAQARADTEIRLNGLVQQRRQADDALYTSSMRSGAKLDAQLGADIERMDALTDAALARGNARILAVKPVSK